MAYTDAQIKAMIDALTVRVNKLNNSVTLADAALKKQVDALTATNTAQQTQIDALIAAGHVDPPVDPPPVVTPPTGDSVAPSAPTGVTATWKAPTVTISWLPSTDAVGVAAYRLVRDEVVISNHVDSPFYDTPPAGKTYVYRVEAFDQAGNTSPRSAPASVNTGTTTTPPPVDPPPVVTPPPTTGGTRDAFLQPFTSDSPWNLPVGSGAVLEATTAAKTNQLRTYQAGMSMNCGQYSHPFYKAKSTDPYADLVDTVHPEQTRKGYIPADAQIAPGSDRHLHVLQPDGKTIIEMWTVTRNSPTSYSSGRIEICDAYGQGIGPQSGTRAYGGSAIGGLIRYHEVEPSDPNYTDGVIRHAIAIAINMSALYYARDGSQSGYDSRGYGTVHGYVWPATEQDWGSEWMYKGQVPMGTYVVIPKSVNLNALGLNAAHIKVAKALQDYGGYITDQTGGNGDPWFSLYCEPKCGPTNWYQTYCGAPTWNSTGQDTIRKQLVVVTNNSASNVNGGGTRPIALAPPLK